MRVRFWGTRGSLAKPGPSTVRYGGNTSCVEVRSASGTRLVIDCGTGGHELGQAIMREGGPSRGHMLISHTHWDHIQGIPFFAPFFVPGHEWDLYAPQGFGESLKETLAGQMEYTYFPVTPDAFGAQVRYSNLGEGRLTIDDLTIHTRYLNHPALTLAFRIEGDGASLVYACDHEPHSRELACGCGAIQGEDEAHAAFIEGADLLIHDAQYLADEYGAKQGWGHSTVEYALTIGRAARVRQLALTHHDPTRSDDAIDAILDRVRQADAPDGPEVFAASEGMEIELVAVKPAAAPAPAEVASAIRHGPGAAVPALLLVAREPRIVERITGVAAAEHVPLLHARDSAEALAMAANSSPAMILAEDRMAGLDGLVAALRGRAASSALPIMLLGGTGGPGHDAADRLEEPWSTEYARARIRTWLLRGECHWSRAPVPVDELDRLAALNRLDILDTPPEERFDRHTRVAAALFRVPVALISFVDADRQWFKSCHGTDERQTSREISFCAHAVAARQMLVVPDTLLDLRFRDNPLVTNVPRVRFYAGAPIHGADGQPVGTLCILDMRPRDLGPEERRLLGDLAGLVEGELRRHALAA